MRIALFSLGLFFAACGPIGRMPPTPVGPDGAPLVRQCDSPAVVSISDNVPEALAPLLMEGVLYWNEVEGYGHERTEFFVEGAPTKDTPDAYPVPGILVVRMADEPAAGPACATTYYVALSDGCIYLAWIEVQPECVADMPAKQILSVIRHEAAHALGLDHSPLAGDLMYPQINMVGHPNGAGRFELTELGARY